MLLQRKRLVQGNGKENVILEHEDDGKIVLASEVFNSSSSDGL